MMNIFPENSFLQICMQIILFFIMIYSLHFLWGYLLDYMAPKKTIHVMDTQIEKYKQIMEEMQQNKKENRIPFFETQVLETQVPESEMIREDLDEYIQMFL